MTFHITVFSFLLTKNIHYLLEVTHPNTDPQITLGTKKGLDVIKEWHYPEYFYRQNNDLGRGKYVKCAPRVIADQNTSKF